MLPTTEQLQALVRTWQLAQASHSAGRVAVNLLAGCYNGSRFKFDLTDLRLLGDAPLRDALAVITMDARPAREVHDLLNTALGRRDIGPCLELLAFGWRIKGCVKAGEVPELRQRIDYLNKLAIKEAA